MIERWRKTLPLRLTKAFAPSAAFDPTGRRGCQPVPSGVILETDWSAAAYVSTAALHARDTAQCGAFAARVKV